jgi:ABC-type multidrug transport system ATPase subunit
MYSSAAPKNAPDDCFDFTLCQGELAVFEIPVGYALPDISGLATGLASPARGKVTFCGTEWREIDQTSGGQQRETIGQVFQSNHRAHWITNLDVDENVYLAEQMTGRISQLDLVAAADKLAKAFGLEEIPGLRASKVSRDRLMRAQWVRAFLPNPLRLLILECPTSGVHSDAVRLLARQIELIREKKTAVVWIGPPLSDLERGVLDITHYFQPTPSALLPAVG